MKNLNLDLGEAETLTAAEDGLVEVTWPVITIDEVDGMPNYETVSINGFNNQIMRGQEVTVGPAIVGVLKTAIGTKYVKKEGADGRIRNTPQEAATIPWRQVGSQKLRVTPKEAQDGYQQYFNKG
jgi:hypothetical protein